MAEPIGTITPTKGIDQSKQSSLGARMQKLSVEDFSALAREYDGIPPVAATNKGSDLHAIQSEFERDNPGTSWMDTLAESPADKLNADLSDLPVKIREQVKREIEAESAAYEQTTPEPEAKNGKSNDKKDSYTERLKNKPEAELTPEEKKHLLDAEKEAKAKPAQGGVPSINLGKAIEALGNFGNRFGNPLKKNNPLSHENTKPISNEIMSNNSKVNQLSRRLDYATRVHDRSVNNVDIQFKKAGFTREEYQESIEAVRLAKNNNEKAPQQAESIVQKAHANTDLQKSLRQQEAALIDLTKTMNPKELEGIKVMSDSGKVNNSAMDKFNGHLTSAHQSAGKGVEIASTKHAGKENSADTNHLEKIQGLLEGMSAKFNLPSFDFVKSMFSGMSRK